MDNPNLSEHVAAIVASYVSRNSVTVAELPDVISTVFAAVSNLGTNTASAGAASEPLHPAVSIRKSITPDYLICLEDGKKLKMLKRHLRTSYNLSPDEYRARWGLSDDYPMVAPNYSARRSEFAKQIGLGTGGRGRSMQEVTPPPPVPVVRRGRGRPVITRGEANPPM